MLSTLSLAVLMMWPVVGNATNPLINKIVPFHPKPYVTESFFGNISVPQFICHHGYGPTRLRCKGT